MDVDGKVFDESDGERILIERLPRSLNKEHGDGREEVSGSESLDESNKEAVNSETMSANSLHNEESEEERLT